MYLYLDSVYLYLYLPSKNHLYLYLYLPMEKLLYLYLQSFFCICPNPDILQYLNTYFCSICVPYEPIFNILCFAFFVKNSKIASEMPVPHSLGKYFQHHEIQKYCTSINFRILSEHCQLYKGPNNV